MSGEYASVGTQSSGVADRGYAAPQGALGWVTFALVMLGITGTLNAIYGIAAISSSSFYVAGAQHVLGDLNTWGWVVLIFGVLQGIAALAILAEAQWARWLGVLLAATGAVVHLVWMPASPLAALAMFGLDVLIVYGLVAHGAPREAIS
jgi:hypothetical protein